MPMSRDFQAIEQLVKDMRFYAKFLDALDEDREFTQEELAILDDVRIEGGGLVTMAEAVITTFQEGR